jgi:hypothetical protein
MGLQESSLRQRSLICWQGCYSHLRSFRLLSIRSVHG